MHAPSNPSDPRRCPRCRVGLEFCFCARLETVDTESSVDIVMHHRERLRSSNTANLALLSLPKARVHVRGGLDHVFEGESVLREGFTPLYLFPLERALPLTEDYVRELKQRDPRPLQLILPDGSWGQARKVLEREKAFWNIPVVCLRGLPPSRYRLRTGPSRDGMATFEALAHALSVIEGRDRMAGLFRNFEVMVEQNLKMRGRFPFDRNTCAPGVNPGGSSSPNPLR